MRALDQNIAVSWSNAVRRYAENTCTRYRKDGSWMSRTYAEVDEIVRHFAQGLLHLGVDMGDRLALLSENRPCWAYTDLACQSLGAVLVPIYSTNLAKDVGYIVKDSGARVLAVSNHFQLSKAMESKIVQRQIEHVIIFDPIPDLTDRDERVKSFWEVINLGKTIGGEDKLEARMQEIQPEDLATLIYTSGTTGDAKGAMLTHRNLLSNIAEAAALFRISYNDVTLSILPLSHSLERTAGHFTPLLSGATIAYADSIGALAADLKEVQPTILVGVPRVFEKLKARISEEAKQSSKARTILFERALAAGEEAFKRRQKDEPVPLALEAQCRVFKALVFKPIHDSLGGNLRCMISGGAPLALSVCQFFFNIGLPLYEGYGLTETSPVVTVNHPGALRLGTVGKSIDGVEVRIAKDGEILVSGPNVMRGYWGHPQLTKGVIEDGWFHTGDIGQLDRDGFLKITDRKKDLIVTSNGKNVAPRHIETILATNKFVAQACVVGDRRPFLTAVIVPEQDEIFTWGAKRGQTYESFADMAASPAVRELFDKIVDDVNKRMASYQRIRGYILSDVEFTQENNLLTATQKVRRKEVDRRFSHELEHLY